MRAIGVKELTNHIDGKRLTLGQVVKAKCAECTAKYADGKNDCGIEGCPLYPYMPYNAAKVALRGTRRKISV